MLSVVDVAVRITVVPTIVGNVLEAPGTVKVIGVPWAEWVPLTNPKLPVVVQLMPPHVADQSTPSLLGSPATTAATLRFASDGNVAGGACVMVTPDTVDVMVTVAENVLLRSVVDIAVTETVFPLGTERGAVNVLLPPLAVCAGEKDPQVGALPQRAAQFTPALAISLLTVADTVAVPPIGMEAGGVWVSETEMSGVSELFVFAPVEQPGRQTTPTTNATKTGNPPRRFDPASAPHTKVVF